MSESLDSIRKQIDMLDNKIHDLLMQRAALVLDISREKEKANLPTVQPAREAQMIRRLLKRHSGALPEAAIVRIWRELVTSVSLLQAGLKVAVAAPDASTACWDLAKDYFGSVLPMMKSSSALTAISAVRSGETSFAVLPWPQDGDSNPWWGFLVNQEPAERMRIIGALPYGSEEETFTNLMDKALVISRSDFSPSGEDHSFLGLEVHGNVSRARIVDGMKAFDLEPLSVSTRLDPVGVAGRGLHIVEVDDYIAEDDARLKKIEQKFEEFQARCVSLGGYPVPPIFKARRSHKESPPSLPDKSAVGA